MRLQLNDVWVRINSDRFTRNSLHTHHPHWSWERFQQQLRHSITTTVEDGRVHSSIAKLLQVNAGTHLNLQFVPGLHWSPVRSADYASSGIALAAQEAGLEVLGYTSQARFLMNCGLLDLLEQADLRTVAHAQKLLTEHEMGELFKVIGFARGCDPAFTTAPLGFAHGDRSHTL